MRKTLKRASKLSDSIPKGTMAMSGLVRTTTGYCIARVELSEDGTSVLGLKLGASQAFPENLVPEHKRVLVQYANRAMGIR